MSRSIAASVLLLSASAGIAQVPPGYRIIQVTEGPEYDSVPRLNNAGQIVFSRRMDPQYGYTSEIFLYDANTRELTRLTNDNVIDFVPDINDNGAIVWSRAYGEGSPTLEVVRLEKGVLTRLTDDGFRDLGPRINENGHIVWYKWHGLGCDNDSANIYLYDGQSVIPITNDLWSNQGPEINDLDQIVWSQRDFCPQGYWDARVMLYSDGSVTRLSPDGVLAADGPTMNNAAQVVWHYDLDDGTGGSGLQIWENGSIRLLTDWGQGATLNEHGGMCFHRWHESNRTWQVWLYRHGIFFQLSDDPFWNSTADINERGECAWQSGQYPEGDVRILQRLSVGDLNCDGSINVFDIQPFVIALSDPDGYAGQYPACDVLLADANEDGSINQFDIQSFLGLLTR